jgi:RNA polymerase sigma-70 factor (ECF subfamily)
MEQQNDLQLIGRILRGDTAGYSVLVDRYKDLAFTIAFRILGRREDAEEVVQDAFLKAFKGLSGFRQHARFSTWFYRIVYNTAISKNRLKRFNFQSIEEMIIPENLQEIEEDEEHRGPLLDQALQQLSEEERVIVTLYYINESSVEDIHSITGLSKSNVKIKLFRARKKLQVLVTMAAVKAI